MDYDKFHKDTAHRRQEVVDRLAEIFKEKALLDGEKEEKQRELAAIEQILEGLDTLSSDEPLEAEPFGTSDHVRRLLQQTPVHLLPTQIRDSLLSVGITGSSPKNLLIGVHNVLSRLEGFLESTEINNRKAYRWKRQLKKAPRIGVS
jgi:hypothetical protein